MYVSGPYREWADFLHDQKCGGRPEPEPLTFTIGTTYDLYWCGNFEERRTITPENKAWFERVFNDPENDLWHFERVDPADKKEGG